MNLVTTPIFYINSKPHIGHFYSLLLADSIKKTLQVKSNTQSSSSSIKLTTGTDEHGQKVFQSSVKEKMNIKEYCNKYSDLFRSNASLSKADFDDFIRTTEERHKQTVEIYWERLKGRGFIRKDKYEGYYSISDESFIPVKDLVRKEGIQGKSVEFTTKDDKKVEYLSEETYNFIVTDELLLKYKEMLMNKRLIIDKQEEVNEYITSNLTTFSLSRPVNRVNWGVNIESNHTVYVWFDALLNYITTRISYSSQDFNKITFDDIRKMLSDTNFTHVIGKDITKFHCYLFPLLLLASDSFPNRLQVISHSHLLINNVKMSKSLNNSLYPKDLIRRNTYSALRYFLLSAGPLKRDVSFSEDLIKKTFFTDIADSVTNLVMRLTNKKLFSVNDFSLKEGFSYSNKEILGLIEENTKTISKVKSLYDAFDFNSICFSLHSIMVSLNKFIHHSEFWEVSKTRNISWLKEIIVFSLETVRIFFIFLYPILPEYSLLFMKILGHDSNQIKFDYGNYDYIHHSQGDVMFNVDVDNISQVFINKIG